MARKSINITYKIKNLKRIRHYSIINTKNYSASVNNNLSFILAFKNIQKHSPNFITYNEGKCQNEDLKYFIILVKCSTVGFLVRSTVYHGLGKYYSSNNVIYQLYV